MAVKKLDIIKESKLPVYVGAGTLIVILGGAFLTYRLLKKKPIAFKRMDTSVFDSPDLIGSGSCVDPLLVSRLQQLEQRTGYPIFSWINSGVRTSYWNKKVGGVSNSSHEIPNCKAVDIKAANKAIRNRLVVTAKAIGFKRIGVGKTFVHLDVDSSKSQYVAWGYPKGVRPAINPFV